MTTMRVARSRERPLSAARALTGGVDRLLLGLVVLMVFLGVVAVFDATYPRQADSNPFFYLYRQLAWAGTALIALWVAMNLPYQFWRRTWLLAPLIAILLLVAVLLVGPEIKGAKRWLVLAGPIRFQPSEFAKLAVVIFLAGYAAVMRSHIARFWKGFVPATLMLGIIGALVAKEDLGTGIAIVLTGMLMIYVAGGRVLHLLGLGAAALGAGAYAVMSEPYRLERIWAWLDPEAHVQGAGYQVWEGLLTLGSGQLTGKGFTQGVGKHLYLPAAHTDYIFAVIGEELGLVSVLVILLLFLILLYRGLNIAHQAPDRFGGMLALGLIGGIIIQAMMNIAVVTASVPATGLPLPFISYGGSSLVATALALGIVLNISQQSSRGAPASHNMREPSGEVRPHGWRHGRPRLSRY